MNESRIAVLEDMLRSQNDEILKLHEKLSKIEALIGQQAHCEYIQSRITKQIHEIINEK